MARRNKKDNSSKEYYKAFWVETLSNLATNIFVWKNLPEEINPDAMEKTLMLGGYVTFFKDKQLDKYFALGGALTGVDVYGYPTRVQPIGKNTDYLFDEYQINKDCILMYAMKTRDSALRYIDDFADRLAEVDVAIKMNTNAMKHPVIISTPEQSRESFETFARQYEEDYYIIVKDSSMSTQGISTLNLGVTANEILSLQKVKETIYNDFYRIFGISSATEKRERIVQGEIQAMQEQIAINRAMWLNTRLEACERINKMFGLNVSVEVNRIELPNENQEQETKEEEVNE